MEEIIFFTVELFFHGFFDWSNKKQRSLALIALVALITVLYCLGKSYFVTAGFFTFLMFVALFAKIHFRHKDDKNANTDKSADNNAERTDESGGGS